MAVEELSNDPKAHRVLIVPPHFDDPQRGKDVTALQKAVNDRIKNNPDIEIRRLKVDGRCGRDTVATTRQVARALGIGIRGVGLTVYLQKLVRDPAKRTAAQRARGKRYRAEHRTTTCQVNGNKVTGGESDRQRVVAAAMQAAKLYSEGKSHRFYSQPGVTTFDRVITGERSGERSDCSQWFVGCFLSAGAKDPCAGDYNTRALHYTGTIPKGGRYISREALRPGDAVLYGPPPHHHVEIWVGNGDGKTTYAALARTGSAMRDRTVGHGSPPVDYGDIDMLAGPRFVTYP